MRHSVYPGRVAAGKMSQEDMDREIGTMAAAADSIEKMAKNGLFRETWNALAEARSMSPIELVAEIALAQELANKLTVAGQVAEARPALVRLAGLTLRLTEVMSELPAAKEVATDAPAASAPGLVPPVPSAIAAAKPLEYASATQKEEIIRLLNNPVIQRSEKTKVLLNINKLDPQQATDTIARLQGQIEQQSGPVAYRKAS